MTEPRRETKPSAGVSADLVEYFIVGVPSVDRLDLLAPALAELVAGAAIRILDLVVVVKDGDGAVAVFEPEDLESMGALGDLECDIGGMLSERDLALASSGLRPGTAALVMVTEDRWAEPLSLAARHAGGQIIAGERIPAARVETALADRSEDPGA